MWVWHIFHILDYMCMDAGIQDRGMHSINWGICFRPDTNVVLTLAELGPEYSSLT